LAAYGFAYLAFIASACFFIAFLLLFLHACLASHGGKQLGDAKQGDKSKAMLFCFATPPACFCFFATLASLLALFFASHFLLRAPKAIKSRRRCHAFIASQGLRPAFGVLLRLLRLLAEQEAKQASRRR
jgi:hypothetical protein